MTQNLAKGSKTIIKLKKDSVKVGSQNMSS